MRIFDTLAWRKEPFKSAVPGKVDMFVCGPTVQDYMHLGHARTYLFYDMLSRYLAYQGNRVSTVINITDIDEGIVKGAREAGTSVEAFASKYGKAFVDDMAALGVTTVSSYHPVSELIPQMIAQTESLIARGNAYRIGASVYFGVDTFPGFGELSHQTRDEIALRPLEIAEGKRNQADFSLWRGSNADEQRWDSPWGLGTPGWHIQDTAVSFVHFPRGYDIHGGARELVYPHHEAQRAEMNAYSGKARFVRYWVHSGLLTQHSEKMSKSRGTSVKVREILRDFSPGALRLYFLGMHHREDAEFREADLKRWEEKYWSLRSNSTKLQREPGRRAKLSGDSPFVQAMNDDLRAGEAISYLVKTVERAARAGEGRAGEALQLLKVASSVLGAPLVE